MRPSGEIDRVLIGARCLAHLELRPDELDFRHRCRHGRCSVDRAIGEDGAGDEGIAGEEGTVGDQGALGDEEEVVDAGA